MTDKTFESTYLDYVRSMNNKVRETAYFKWIEAGQPPGDGTEFWYAAEKELKLGKKSYTADPYTISDYAFKAFKSKQETDNVQKKV